MCLGPRRIGTGRVASIRPPSQSQVFFVEPTNDQRQFGQLPITGISPMCTRKTGTSVVRHRDKPGAGERIEDGVGWGPGAYPYRGCSLPSYPSSCTCFRGVGLGAGFGVSKP